MPFVSIRSQYSTVMTSSALVAPDAAPVPDCPWFCGAFEPVLLPEPQAASTIDDARSKASKTVHLLLIAFPPSFLDRFGHAPHASISVWARWKADGR